jgi:hypothetical protein
MQSAKRNINFPLRRLDTGSLQELYSQLQRFSGLILTDAVSPAPRQYFA